MPHKEVFEMPVPRVRPGAFKDTPDKIIVLECDDHPVHGDIVENNVIDKDGQKQKVKGPIPAEILNNLFPERQFGSEIHIITLK
jgi:hypothetical protein